MILPLVVTVVIDGVPIASSSPARLVAGSVTAPVDPFVRLIARRISTDAERGRITFERDGRCLTVSLGSRAARADRVAESLPIAPYVRDGKPIIPLAATARALGAEVRYDSATRTLVIDNAKPVPLSTPTPYAQRAVPPGPLPTFTAEPVPTPRPTITGVPRPRRTPIVVSSQP